MSLLASVRNTVACILKSIAPNRLPALTNGVLQNHCKVQWGVNLTLRSGLSNYLSRAELKMRQISSSFVSQRTLASLNQMHKTGPFIKKRSRPKPTEGQPQMKGVVLKTFVKKPKKPNSANRKCVRVRLSNGREAIAYIPGEGHTLQEHSIVLVYPRNVQDLPGVNLKCIRGKYDLGHVIKK